MFYFVIKAVSYSDTFILHTTSLDYLEIDLLKKIFYPGEANLTFARGDPETAIKLCMEVIQTDPSAPDPFQTLSTVYEQLDEFEKSVQFALIGAHLAPPDADEWERLANMSLELGDTKQAASCLKKAIDR